MPIALTTPTSASIAKISEDARSAAFKRHKATGEAGIRVHDVLSAIADELESVAGGLSRTNCRDYLTDLPQDVDVVSVEPIRRKVSRQHSYLHVA